MAILRRVSYRNQITLPPSILKEAGADYGTLFSIEAKDGKIILEPKKLVERELAPEDWDAMDRLVRRQLKAGQFTEYSDPRSAKKHFQRAPR